DGWWVLHRPPATGRCGLRVASRAYRLRTACPPPSDALSRHDHGRRRHASQPQQPQQPPPQPPHPPQPPQPQGVGRAVRRFLGAPVRAGRRPGRGGGAAGHQGHRVRLRRARPRPAVHQHVARAARVRRRAGDGSPLRQRARDAGRAGEGVRRMSAADAPSAGPDGERVQTLLVLGARGDLTERLLLPGLGDLVAASGLTDLFLVGSDRGSGSDEEWRTLVARAFAAGGANGPAVDAVVRNSRYLAADATAEEDLRRLLASCRGRLTLYFALPPAITVEACRALARIGVPEGTRLVLEKPFGTDAA